MGGESWIDIICYHIWCRHIISYLLSFAKIVQQIDIHKFCEDKFIYINNSNENLYDSQINSKFAVIRKQIKKPK